MDWTSVGNQTDIQLTVDSNAVQQWKAGMLYRTWGDPTGSDPSQWISLANGGYIKSLTMGLFAEPVVALDFVVIAGSAETTFTITSAVLNFLPINAEGTANAGMTVTDQNGDGATLTGLYAGKAYEATYNGGTLFADLVPPGDVPPWQAMGTVSSMQASFKFTLSAYDAASATSTYTTRKVPEPSSLVTLLASITGLAGFAYRRRRS